MNPNFVSDGDQHTDTLNLPQNGGGSVGFVAVRSVLQYLFEEMSYHRLTPHNSQ